jgi:hypothetical protein
VCDQCVTLIWIILGYCIIACETGFLATQVPAGRRLRTEIGVIKSTRSLTESAC